MFSRARARAAVSLTLIAAALGSLTSPVSAQAAAPCGATGLLSDNGTTSSCTYDTAGYDSFTVPARVGSVTMHVFGGAGQDEHPYGTSGTNGNGGVGGATQLTVSVSPGQEMAIGVAQSGAAGGAPGGGSGGSAQGGATAGGTGGGYSSVYLSYQNYEYNLAGPDVVAAGGGGGGGTDSVGVNIASGTDGGEGGAGGGASNGGNGGGGTAGYGCPIIAPCQGGWPGAGATSTAGGKGATCCYTSENGSNGSAWAGGAGGPGNTPGSLYKAYGGGGGGGGGGWYGGGGGGGGNGSNFDLLQTGGGGGGGGSGYCSVPCSVYGGTDTNSQTGQVIISWTDPPPLPPSTITATVFDGQSQSQWSDQGEPLGSTAYYGSYVHVSGAAPTGTVTYYLYSGAGCAGTPLSTQQVTLTGPASDSSASQSLGAGTYSYLASYSGDGTYQPSTGSCQPFSVNPQSPTATLSVNDAATSAAWSRTEVTGASAYASVTLSGTVNGFTPTGTITYNLYDGRSCANNPVASDTESLSGGQPAISKATGALPPGTYSYHAVYSGDGSYYSAGSLCVAFAVATATPALSITVHDQATGAAWSGSEATGAKAYAAAALTGVAAGIDATGLVTYSLYAGSACQGPAVVQDSTGLNGGQPTPSPASAALAGGRYSYSASFQSADSNYASAQSACVAFSVAPVTPNVALSVDNSATGQPWQGGEKIGAAAYASATVSGLVAGFTPTSAVTFDLYDGGSCAGTPVSSDLAGVSAGQASSTSTGELAAGTYSYRASYPGAGNYGSASSGCVSFVLAPVTPGLSVSVLDAGSSSGWAGSESTGASAQASARLSGVIGGFTATGSVTYSLYSGTGCTGTPAAQTVLLSGGAVPLSQSTGQLAAGSYS
ncbi:MAG: hypothetical protein ACYCXW_18660, partial [Solirubrobacteraceae bacterium]